MAARLAKTLISAWMQVLVDDAKILKLDDRSRRVRRTSRSHLREALPKAGTMSDRLGCSGSMFICGKACVLTALEQNDRERCSSLDFVNVDPVYDLVSSEPRFQAVVRNINSQN